MGNYAVLDEIYVKPISSGAIISETETAYLMPDGSTVDAAVNNNGAVVFITEQDTASADKILDGSFAETPADDTEEKNEEYSTSKAADNIDMFVAATAAEQEILLFNTDNSIDNSPNAVVYGINDFPKENRYLLQSPAAYFDASSPSRATFTFNVADIGWADGSFLNSADACSQGTLAVEIGDKKPNRGCFAIGSVENGFQKDVSLFAGGEVVGTLKNNGSKVKYGNCLYSLSVSGNVLYLNIEYEAAANNVRLQENTGGKWSVKNSGTSMKKISVKNGQILDADRGGFISEITVDGGAVRVQDGALAQNITVNRGELSAGRGYIENAILNNGYLTATNGGIIRNTTVNGGAVITKNSGIASNTVVKAGSIEVCSEGIIKQSVVSGGAILRTYSGGSATEIRTESGATVYVENNGLLKKTVISSGGKLGIFKGGICENTTIQTGGEVYISAGANVSDMLFNGEDIRLQIGIASNTNVHFVSDGKGYRVRNGNLTEITAGANTYLEVYEGGVVSKLHTKGHVEPFGSGAGGAMQLHNGGKAFDVDNHQSGQINVFSGGYLSGAYTDTEGEIYLSGGYAQKLEAGQNGFIWIHSGGVGSDIVLNSNGKLTVSSGGSADTLIINEGHAIVEQSNAYLTNAVINNSGTLEVCGASASNIVISSGGLMTFSDKFKQMDGPWIDSPNGQGYNIAVSEGGVLAVRETGSATGATLHSGAELQIWSNAEVLELTALNGAYTIIHNGGKLTGADIKAGAQLDISSGAKISDLKFSDGAKIFLNFHQGMDVSGSCNGTEFFVAANSTLTNYSVCGEVNFHTGTKAKSITVKGGSRINVNAGASVDTVTVNKDGIIYVFENGKIQNLTTYGTVNIAKGASADEITVYDGYLSVFAGATVEDLLVNNGGAIIYGGNISDFELGNAGRAEIANAAVTDLEVTGKDCVLTIKAGADITDMEISNGTVLINGGKVVDVELTQNANAQINSGATAEKVTVQNGYFTINSGAEVSDLTVGNGGIIINGGSTTNLELQKNDGRIQVGAGAAVKNVFIKDGYITINAGASISDLQVSKGGAIINGGSITDFTLTATGSCQIGAGATVKNITLSGSKCGLTILAGATLTGQIDLANGMVAAQEGVNVIFDLTTDFAASVTTPLVTGYEFVEKANLTISVTSTLSPGIYKLASTSNGLQFRSTTAELVIDGQSAETLTLGSQVFCGGNSYALYQDDSDELVVEIAPLTQDMWGTEPQAEQVVYTADECDSANNSDLFCDTFEQSVLTADICSLNLACGFENDLFKEEKTSIDAMLA